MSMALDFVEEVEEHDAPIVTQALQRSKPQYPAKSPAGEEWRDYFKRLKAEVARGRAEDDAEPAPEVEILAWATDLEDPCTAPGAVGTLAKRLTAQGWYVRVRTSRAAVPAVLFVADSEEGAENPHQKGDVRYAAYEVEPFVMIAWKRVDGHMLALDATWERKDGASLKFVAATTHDPFLGREWRTGSRKPRKPRAWEIEEDVPPPAGFEEWLALVAPKPAPKPKTRKKELQDAA